MTPRDILEGLSDNLFELFRFRSTVAYSGNFITPIGEIVVPRVAGTPNESNRLDSFFSHEIIDNHDFSPIIASLLLIGIEGLARQRVL